MSFVTKSWCTGRLVLTLFLQFAQLICSKKWYGLLLIYEYNKLVQKYEEYYLIFLET